MSLTTNDSGLTEQYALLKTKHGEIKIQFYPEDAPATVERIIKLISDGFYDGLVFHRVIPGFVAQTGDPTGTGTSGSGVKLKAEFNERRHTPGTVAMARAADPNSADSQFYITLDNTPHLDRQYTIFGQVTEGFDNVLSISQGDTIESFSFHS
ncbi:MAG: peptidylprolyl isomerase [Halobacteriovoraceae bacterium]|nr:peptidylprolyl isomerase [Halobacteriovoraceae bacterium]